MRMHFLGFLILLLSSRQSLLSQENRGPVMTFETKSIDFGEREFGPDVILDFWFQNTGNEPLIISNVRTSGGGLMAESWPKEPVKPDQRTFVRVRYYGQRVGPTIKSFTVESNSKDQPAIVLGIKGKIKDPPLNSRNPGGPSNN